MGNDPVDAEEKYRPDWYKGEREDMRAYHLASAERVIDEANSKGPNGGSRYPTVEDIQRMARVGRMCGCGECFSCAVLNRIDSGQVKGDR